MYEWKWVKLWIILFSLCFLVVNTTDANASLIMSPACKPNSFYNDPAVSPTSLNVSASSTAEERDLTHLFLSSLLQIKMGR